MVIPTVFLSCYPFKSGIATVMDTLYDLKLLTKDGRVLEYNDENIGKKVLLPPRNSYPGCFETKTGQGRMNEKGDTIVPPIYKVTSNLMNGMYIVQDKTGKWGAYNDKGEIILNPKFDWIGHFHNGLAIFKLNGKYGYVNKKGITVIEPQFGYVGAFACGLAYAEINGKSGFINRKGKFVINPTFEPNPGSEFR